jgi:glycosyltransferase involved in cell wall biosynthesis
MNKIDVIIPTYNRADYLKMAIDSVLDQTYKNFNLYVLDNCSTDHTSKLMKTYSANQLTYIKNEENHGFIGNLNKALETGTSEYFQIFHDDDMLEPNFLESVVSFLDKFKDLAFVHSASHIINEENNVVKEHVLDYPETLTTTSFFDFYLEKGVSIICPSVVFRREKISGKIIFNNNTPFTADVVFFISSSNYGGVGYINKPIFKYREHTLSLTSSLYANYDLRLKDRFYHKQFLADELNKRKPINTIDYADKYYKKAISADIWFMRMQGTSRIKLLRLLPKITKLSPSIIFHPFFWVSLSKILIPIGFIKFYKNNLRK